jgi:hypothetical protein
MVVKGRTNNYDKLGKGDFRSNSSDFVKSHLTTTANHLHNLADKRDSAPIEDQGLAYWKCPNTNRRWRIRSGNTGVTMNLISARSCLSTMQFWKVHFYQLDTLLHLGYLLTSTHRDRLQRINNWHRTTSTHKVETVLFRNIHGEKIIIVISTKHDRILKQIC